MSAAPSCEHRFAEGVYGGPCLNCGGRYPFKPADPKHFWSSGMQREQATLYLLDLCGSDSQNYTETESEVTCERCFAALRAGSSSPRFEVPAGSSGSITQALSEIVYHPDAVAEQVRAAVLKEREDIIETAQAMRALDGNTDYRTALRHVIEEIRRRS